MLPILPTFGASGKPGAIQTFKGDPALYQLKSWFEFHPQTFLKQIQEDLRLLSLSVEDLTPRDLRAGLKWVFDPRKMSRERAIQSARAAIQTGIAEAGTRTLLLDSIEGIIR